MARASDLRLLSKLIARARVFGYSLRRVGICRTSRQQCAVGDAPWMYYVKSTVVTSEIVGGAQSISVWDVQELNERVSEGSDCKKKRGRLCRADDPKVMCERKSWL